MNLQKSKLIANPLIHKGLSEPDKVLEMAIPILDMFHMFVEDEDQFYLVWNSFRGHESDLLHLYFVSKFHVYINQTLPITERTIFISLLFSIVDALGPRTGRRLKEVISKFALYKDKERLVKSFMYSNEIPIRVLTQTELEDYKKKALWFHVFCEYKRGILGADPCGMWCEFDDKKIDQYLGQVLDHLYEMRNSVIHRAAIAFYVADPNVLGGSTVIDSYYPLTNKEVISYESDKFDRAALSDIVLSCLWRELVSKTTKESEKSNNS